MKRILILAAMLGAMATSTTSFAQARITNRQHNQQARIAQGMRNGQLTPREGRNLERREMRLQRNKRMAMRDGYMSRFERARLRREENRNSVAIYRAKHNFRRW